MDTSIYSEGYHDILMIVIYMYMYIHCGLKICMSSEKMVQYELILAQTVVIKRSLTWLQNNIKSWERDAVVSIVTTAT